MTATRVLPCECCQRNSLGVDPQLVLTQVNRRSGPRELNSTQAATSRSVWTLSTTHLSATRSSPHPSFPGECHHSFPWQLLPGGGGPLKNPRKFSMPSLHHGAPLHSSYYHSVPKRVSSEGYSSRSPIAANRSAPSPSLNAAMLFLCICSSNFRHLVLLLRLRLRFHLVVRLLLLWLHLLVRFLAWLVLVLVLLHDQVDRREALVPPSQLQILPGLLRLLRELQPCNRCRGPDLSLRVQLPVVLAANRDLG